MTDRKGLPAAIRGLVPRAGFVAGFCNGMAWGHIFASIALLGVSRMLAIGVFLMAGGWRAAQFRWEDAALRPGREGA